MCKLLLPKNDIACIRYFTALVKPRPNDPQQGQRQQIFLRALKTLPNISIHYGTFLSHVVPMQQRGSARPAGESSTPRRVTAITAFAAHGRVLPAEADDDHKAAQRVLAQVGPRS